MSCAENHSLTGLEWVNVSRDLLTVCGEGGFREQLPVILLLVSVLVLGVIGNSLVFFTWASRPKQSSCSQFILHLALYDITACLSVIPVSLVGLLQRNTIKYNNICRSYMFLCLLFSLSSLATLDLVAVDRFLKICRPLSYGIPYEASRRLFVLEFITGLVFALATLFLQGLGQTDSQSSSAYCYREICLLNNDFYQSEYRLVFNIMMFIVLLSMFFVLILCYLLIIKTLLKRRKGYMPPIPLRRGAMSSVKTEEHRLDDMCVKPGGSITGDQQRQGSLPGQLETSLVPTCSKLETTELDISDQHSYNKEAYNVACIKNSNNSDKRMVCCQKFHQKANHRRRVSATKSVKILSFVTVTFVLCWLPTWILGTFIRLRSGESFLEQSPEKHKAVVFFEYWYLTSHAANPLIYAFMDHTFRSECLQLLSRVRLYLRK